RRFATRGAAKFDGAGFQPDADGLPFLEGASISLRCTTYSKVDGGHHLVLIGQVEEVGAGRGDAVRLLPPQVPRAAGRRARITAVPARPPGRDRARPRLDVTAPSA